MAKTGYAPKPAEVHAANLAELKARIKNGNASGAYVFYGDEEYTKNFYYDALANFCGNRSLNVKTLAGSDFKLADFLDSCDTVAANSMDMFALDEEEKQTFRLVRLISPKLDNLNQKETKEFLSRIEDPDDGVIILLWLYAGEQDKIAKGIYKKIADAGLTVNFRREPFGSPTLAAWVLKHFNRAKIEAERSVAMFMVSYVGNDMTTLKNAIDSCISYLRCEGRSKITSDDIRFICTKSETAQIFDISSAALSGDYKTAMEALNVFVGTARSREKAVISVFGPIFKAVNDLCTVEIYSKSGESPMMISKKTGLHEFVVKKNQALLKERAKTYNGKGGFSAYAANVCIEYETKNKTSAGNRYELLRELIFKLCYPCENER